MSYAVFCNASEWEMDWKALPAFPAQGVAGPFIGIFGDDLIVAGGANFPVSPGGNLWDVPKVWHDDVYILHLSDDGNRKWRGGFRLNRPVAYGATVSTPQGLVCMGGEDSNVTFKECFLLHMNGEQLIQTPLPDLPQPCSYGAAAVIGNTVYLAGGQSGRGLDSALHNFWALDLSLLASGDAAFCWNELPATVALPPDLRERHPGFPKRAWVYNTVTDVWGEAGPTPENQIVTPAVKRGDEIFLVSGETGPRLRSQNAWRVTVEPKLNRQSGVK